MRFLVDSCDQGSTPGQSAPGALAGSRAAEIGIWAMANGWAADHARGLHPRYLQRITDDRGVELRYLRVPGGEMREAHLISLELPGSLWLLTLIPGPVSP